MRLNEFISDLRSLSYNELQDLRLLIEKEQLQRVSDREKQLEAQTKEIASARNELSLARSALRVRASELTPVVTPVRAKPVIKTVKAKPGRKK